MEKLWLDTTGGKGCGEVEGGYHCGIRVVVRLRIDMTAEDALWTG